MERKGPASETRQAWTAMATGLTKKPSYLRYPSARLAIGVVVANVISTTQVRIVIIELTRAALFAPGTHEQRNHELCVSCAPHSCGTCWGIAGTAPQADESFLTDWSTWLPRVCDPPRMNIILSIRAGSFSSYFSKESGGSISDPRLRI